MRPLFSRSRCRPTCRGLVVPLLALAVLAACETAPPPRPDVLLVSVDSLRTDRLSLLDPEEGVPVPHLEALAGRGTLYTNAWASSPWTAPSMVSIFTGLQPPSHGVAYRDDTTPPGLPTLPRLLADAGYRLGNFTFFSEISYFRNLGWPDAEPGLAHDAMAGNLARWLDAADGERPVAAWVHLLEPHLPYGATGYRASEVRVPGSAGLEEAQRKAAVPAGTVEFAAGDRQRLVALYDRDVEAFDRTLGEIVDVLAERGRLRETLIVLVADHGEELLEHGWIGHASTAVEAKMVPEILHVPLVVAGPGVPAGRRIEELVQPVDLFPTLLDLLELPVPEPVDGRLLSPFRPFWQGGRDHAFFDSSPGGNLTPATRRGERLQGVSDGRCLLASHVGGAGGEERALRTATEGVTCGPGARRELAAELGRWREHQGEQRLELLAREGAGGAPPAATVDGYAETLRVVAPADGEALGWHHRDGQLILAWEKEAGEGSAEGEETAWWIDYEVGSGARHATGSFRVEQSRVVFGPFPRGFWNDLAGYSPLRFRVIDAAGERRSAWVRFTVEPVAAEEG